MSGLTVFVWVATAASLVAQSPSDEIRNPRTSPADVALGEKTFRSHCSPCHGFKGDGGRGPNLANGVFYHGNTDAALLTNISNGIPGTEMPGLFYSPDRVWQVIAYIRSLNASTPVAGAQGIAQGRELFQQQGCIRCHRVGGEGGSLGPDLTEIGRTRSPEHLRQAIIDPNADVRARYWTVHLIDAAGKTHQGFLLNEDTYSVQFIDFSHQLHSISKSGLRAYQVEKKSEMPSYRDKLSAEQLDQLVAYTSSLRGTP